MLKNPLLKNKKEVTLDDILAVSKPIVDALPKEIAEAPDDDDKKDGGGEAKPDEKK